MKNKEYMSIKKMIEYINKALRYTEGCNFESFASNEENQMQLFLQLAKQANQLKI